eukprot:s5320_g5.t1
MALVASQPALRPRIDAPRHGQQLLPPRWGFRSIASRPCAPAAPRRRAPRLGREAEAAAPAREAPGRFRVRDVATSWAQLTKQVMLVAMPNIGSNVLLLANEQINAILLGRTSSSASLAAVGHGLEQYQETMVLRADRLQ